MLKKIVILLLLMMPILVTAQKVTHVDCYEDDEKNIVITYTLDKEALIFAEVSIDGRSFQRISLMHLSGDVGSNVKPGKSKKIIWNVLEDKDYIIGNVVFRITAQTSANNIIKKTSPPKTKKKVYYDRFSNTCPFAGGGYTLPLGGTYFLPIRTTHCWSMYFQGLFNIPYSKYDNAWCMSLSGTLGPCVKLSKRFGIFAGTGIMWMFNIDAFVDYKPEDNITQINRVTLPFEIGMAFELNSGNILTIQGYTSLHKTIGFGITYTFDY